MIGRASQVSPTSKAQSTYASLVAAKPQPRAHTEGSGPIPVHPSRSVKAGVRIGSVSEAAPVASQSRGGPSPRSLRVSTVVDRPLVLEVSPAVACRSPDPPPRVVDLTSCSHPVIPSTAEAVVDGLVVGNDAITPSTVEEGDLVDFQVSIDSFDSGAGPLAADDVSQTSSRKPLKSLPAHLLGASLANLDYSTISGDPEAATPYRAPNSSASSFDWLSLGR